MLGEKYCGYIDVYLEKKLFGWAIGENADESIILEILSNGKKIGEGLADIPRYDLKEAGFDNINHGFEIEIALSSNSLTHSIELIDKLSGRKISTNQMILSLNQDEINTTMNVINSVSTGFDDEFYLLQHPAPSSVKNAVIDYLTFGWKNGLDPNPLFSVKYYLEHNSDIVPLGIEPFYHWLTMGRQEGRKTSLSYYPAKELSEAEKNVKDYFDITYYLNTYPDVKKAKYNPLVHYMRIGWKEGRNPNREFNTIHYILNNLELIGLGENPLLYFVRHKRMERIEYTAVDTVKKFLSDKIFHAMQDITFPLTLSNAEKLFVIILPEHNEMSGGIFSMFSIANIVKRLKSQHGYEVALMTRPNPRDTTYCRQKNFPNGEDVYRFELIERCQNAKEVYLHIPEYAAPSFVKNLKQSTLEYLKSRDILNVNLLNQNTELMPESIEFQDLRELVPNLTQSVAHHSYFSQTFADRYNLPTLLVPAYTDLSAYNPSTLENKDKLVIYSLDEAPHKEEVLKRVMSAFPDYEFFEIRGITFDRYMDLATRCQFSISFGEGFDGYVAQPIYQGGIGMTVYNEEFFPSADFLKYENFFRSEEDMITNIVLTMKALLSNPERYKQLNTELVAEWDKLYSFDEYVKQIQKLVNREFELFPGSGIEKPWTMGYKIGLSSKIVR